MDLAINNLTHDLKIEVGDLVLTDGVEAVSQALDVRLQFFLGEWFLDTRLGVPYFEKILGQKPRLLVVKQIYRDAILATPGVLELNDLLVDYNGSTRVISVSFSARCSDGVLQYNKEFIL